MLFRSKANSMTKPLASSPSSNNHHQMSEQLANIFRESLQNQQNSKLTQSSSNMSNISENDTSILVRHHTKIIEILEFIIERIAQFETNIEKTPAPDNNQKFLHFTSKQINLSAKQDISAMKVQTVKILSNLSTLKAANNLRLEILDYQKSFYKEAAKESSKLKDEAIIFGNSKDRYRTKKLAEILERHEID